MCLNKQEHTDQKNQVLYASEKFSKQFSVQKSLTFFAVAGRLLLDCQICLMVWKNQDRHSFLYPCQIKRVNCSISVASRARQRPLICRFVWTSHRVQS